MEIRRTPNSGHHCTFCDAYTDDLDNKCTVIDAYQNKTWFCDDCLKEFFEKIIVMRLKGELW